MAAIITDKIKQQLAQTIFDEFNTANIGDSNNYYYIGVGRSQQWQAEAETDVVPETTAADNHDREERLFRYNLQSIKAAENLSFVIPGGPDYDWSANKEYYQYSDAVAGQPQNTYYVRTDENKVYICLRKGKNSDGTPKTSTVKPDHTNTALTPETDGYVWKYMYTITTTAANNFLTTNFMPVEFVDSAESTDPRFSQLSVQNASIPGQIIGYRVITPGGPYTGTVHSSGQKVGPQLTVIGNGSSAKAYAILNPINNSIAAVEIGDSPDASFTSYIVDQGSNYDYANILVSGSTLEVGGTAAVIAPVFGTKNGIGADPRKDLRSTSLMFNIKPVGGVNVNNEPTWPVDQDYRQIGLIRNPRVDSADGTLFTAEAGTALKKMRANLTFGDGDYLQASGEYQLEFDGDPIIYGTDSNAAGYMVWNDDSATIWYHQTEETGFTQFVDGEAVTIPGKFAGSMTIDSANIAPDIDRYSGDVLFVSNQSATTRDPQQTEDIKVVVRL
tara:strand:+ start:4020 stop:5522 length:1503 start_codon:yes stop_codon:yes gene_type:complete